MQRCGLFSWMRTVGRRVSWFFTAELNFAPQSFGDCRWLTIVPWTDTGWWMSLRRDATTRTVNGELTANKARVKPRPVESERGAKAPRLKRSPTSRSKRCSMKKKWVFRCPPIYTRDTTRRSMGRHRSFLREVFVPPTNAHAHLRKILRCHKRSRFFIKCF